MSISMDHMSFKDRLQKAAQYAGVEFGPSSIARSLGLKNRQTVHRWLADDSIPEPEMLFHIAKTYGVEAVWLGSGDGPMVSAPPQDLSPPEKELVTIYRQLPRDKRSSLQAIVRALAKAVVVITLSFLILPAPSSAAPFDIKNIRNTDWMRFIRKFGFRYAARS